MSDQATMEQSSAELFGSNRMWGLKELPLPEPVGWMPQTAGWYGVGLLLLLVFAVLGWRLWKRYKRDAYRREGLLRLEEMSVQPGTPHDLPFLLRRSALCLGERGDVAGLRGEAWIEWLNESAGKRLFHDHDAHLLDDLAFGPANGAEQKNDDVVNLIETSKIWMRIHRAAI